MQDEDNIPVSHREISRLLKLGNRGLKKFYNRGDIHSQFTASLESHRHVIIYGPTGQGKTTLIQDLSAQDDALLIDCRSALSRKDIYRVILSHSGYSVTLERKKSGKLGSKISLKIFGTGLDADGSGTLESKYQELQADLTKGTEVCSLLRTAKPPKYVILNNFDFLSENTQEYLSTELGIFDEQSELRFIIVGRWVDRYYIEKLSPELSGRLEKIHVPLWTTEELNGLIGFYAEASEADLIQSNYLSHVMSVSNGDVGVFCRLCRIYYESIHLSDYDIESFKNQVRDYLVDRFLDINLSRILEFCFLRDLLVSFSVSLQVDKTRRKTGVFENIPELRKFLETNGLELDNSRISPIAGEKVSYYYEEQYEDTERNDYGVFLGFWLLSLVLSKHEATVMEKIPLPEVTSRFRSDFLNGANPIDERRLEKVFTSISKIQNRNGIYPEIMSYDARDKTINLTDKQLLAYARHADREDFFQELEEFFEAMATSIKAKRKNDLCKKFVSRNVDRILIFPRSNYGNAKEET